MILVIVLGACVLMLAATCVAMLRRSRKIADLVCEVVELHRHIINVYAEATDKHKEFVVAACAAMVATEQKVSQMAAMGSLLALVPKGKN